MKLLTYTTGLTTFEYDIFNNYLKENNCNLIKINKHFLFINFKHFDNFFFFLTLVKNESFFKCIVLEIILSNKNKISLQNMENFFNFTNPDFTDSLINNKLLVFLKNNNVFFFKNNLHILNRIILNIIQILNNKK